MLILERLLFGLDDIFIILATYAIPIVPFLLSLIPTIASVISIWRKIGKTKNGKQAEIKAKWNIFDFLLIVVFHSVCLVIYFVKLFFYGLITSFFIVLFVSSPFLSHAGLLAGLIIALVIGTVKTRCPVCGRFFALNSTTSTTSKNFSHYSFKENEIKEIYDVKYRRNTSCVYCDYNSFTTSTVEETC